MAANDSFKLDSLVVLQNLSREALNGAIGRMAGAMNQEGRLPVKLLWPEAAIALVPTGVNAKPANLRAAVDEDWPTPQGVRVESWQTTQVRLTHEQTRRLCVDEYKDDVGGRRWFLLPVPHRLGVPLAMLRLDPKGLRLEEEQMATWLCVDPVSGFAPPQVQAKGLGPVLVARADLQDLTDDQLLEVHDYMSHLLDMWSDWEPGNARHTRQREQAQTPNAFQRFTTQRRQERARGGGYMGEEEEDEEDG